MSRNPRYQLHLVAILVRLYVEILIQLIAFILHAELNFLGIAGGHAHAAIVCVNPHIGASADREVLGPVRSAGLWRKGHHRQQCS